MIHLNHLSIKNFLSHVDSDLPLKEYSGLVLIEGITSDGHYSSNGSGKSTILEGIIYALTGDTLRGVSVNDVVNRNYKKDTRVGLEFSKEEENYAVSRYRKDDIYGDSLVLKKNEEDISKRLNKDTQKSLEDILGISYKVLISTMLLGEGLSSRFTQLSDPEKKSLIESTLNLNYDISSIRSDANQKLSALRLEQSNLAGRISTLKDLLSLDVGECEELCRKYNELSGKASKEIEELKSSLAKLQGSRELMERKIGILRDTLFKQSSLESELKRLDDEVLIYVHELEKLTTSSVHHCALCNQELSSVESRDAVESNYKEKIKSIHSRMLDIQSQLSGLPDKKILEENYERLHAELKGIDTEYERVNSQLNTLNSSYWEYRSFYDKAQADLKSYHDNTADINSLEVEYSNVSKEIDIYKYFYDLFSPTGIIVSVLSDAVDYINTRLSAYSGVLLEREYRLNFVKGKISLVDKEGASYQSLSNGEKRRLDISLQFALHDYIHTYCGMQMDCCFIDEILDTVDDVGIDNIFEVLRLKLDYCKLKSIYVITHNDALKEKFDQVITVRKDSSGDSKIL